MREERVVTMRPVPTLLVSEGYVFRFRTGDCAERPHVHVTGNGGSAKVWMDPLEVARFRAYNRHQMTQLLSIVMEHEAAWLRRWSEVCG